MGVKVCVTNEGSTIMCKCLEKKIISNEANQMVQSMINHHWERHSYYITSFDLAHILREQESEGTQKLMNSGSNIHVQIHDHMKRFDEWKAQYICNPTGACPNNSSFSHGDEWGQYIQEEDMFQT